MNIATSLIIISMVLSIILVKVLFCKSHKEHSFKKLSKESEDFKYIDNFIESLKIRFETGRDNMRITLGFLFALFIGFKVVGVVYAIAYYLLALIFIISLLVYLGLNKWHSESLARFYRLKDRFK